MPTESYRFAADLVLMLHAAIVAFIVLGLALILLGAWRGWSWVRNPWFRAAHLAAMVVVALQAWFGQLCPLTTLEMWLRERGGDTVYANSFIAHWLGSLLYVDAPLWVFTWIYSGFVALIALAWWWVRPRSLLCHKVS